MKFRIYTYKDCLNNPTNMPWTGQLFVKNDNGVDTYIVDTYGKDRETVSYFLKKRAKDYTEMQNSGQTEIFELN